MKSPSKKKVAPKRQPRRNGTLTMTGIYSLSSAVSFREMIVQRLAAGQPLSIDAGAAESIDIGSLQVLIAAQRSADAKGQDLRIIAPEGTAISRLVRSAGFLHPDGQSVIPEVAKWLATRESPK